MSNNIRPPALLRYRPGIATVIGALVPAATAHAISDADLEPVIAEQNTYYGG
jgi:hypothetical protein